MQGMQSQSYDLEGPTQANAVLASSNSTIMVQLSQMNVTMNYMQAQLKTLASAQTNQARSKRKHYCWSCGGNFTSLFTATHPFLVLRSILMSRFH